jgi:hypothetical protein
MAAFIAGAIIIGTDLTRSMSTFNTFETIFPLDF